MKMVWVMDPLGTVKPHKDTSYWLMLAAYERGHQIYHVEQGELSVRHNQVVAKARELKVFANESKPFAVEAAVTLDLNQVDVVWIRKDPPFDRRYFYTTLLLDLVRGPRIINRPAALRSWNEKLAALFFADFTPPTLISSQSDEIENFIQVHGEAVVKPLDGHGGRGVQLVKASSADLNTVIDRATHGGSHLMVAQKMVAEAQLGDKRILLVDGVPIGAVLRVAPPGGFLNNLDQGGVAHPCELTKQDLVICDATGPILRREGLYFVGIDLLGPYLTEINVTSPTGLQEICRFSGIAHHQQIITGLEATA